MAYEGTQTAGQLPIGTAAGQSPLAATLTQGANITITDASGSITISANSGAQTVKYTAVNHAASPYTVAANDFYLAVDASGGTVTLLFPNTPSQGRQFMVKDATGDSFSNNITLTTVGGTDTFDVASTSYVISSNYFSLRLTFDGTSNYQIN